MKRSLVLGSLFLFAACGSYARYKGPYNEATTIGGDRAQTDSTKAEAPVQDGEQATLADSAAANPFVSTAFNAVSTFGADVDTASYQYFRSVVRTGTLPAPTEVRLEDFVNSFAYDYPAPELGDLPFSITAAAARNGMGRQTTLLRIGIRTPVTPVEQKRPVNLVFLQDVSGSMSGMNGLKLCQEMMRGALDAMDPTDKIALVTYAGNVRVALSSTAASDKSTILAAINDLESGGSTAGAAGITLAYEQASNNFIQDGINHVVLCTDGDFNVGLSTDQELLDLIKSKRDSGITLTAIGAGSHYNDEMMEKVSNAGNGIHAYLGDSQQASTYGRLKLLGTIVHVAKDVKLQVEFNKTRVQAYRLLGYENRVLNNDDFRNDKVDAGEIGTDHRVTALYELILSDEQMPQPEGAPAMRSGDPVAYQAEIDPTDLALVKVRFKKPTETDADAAREVHVSVSAVAEAMTDPDFQFAAAIAGFAEILRKSPYAVSGQIDAIAAVFAAQASRDADRAELNTLFMTSRTLLGL
jgi:Ca-activated chloride channel family protein